MTRFVIAASLGLTLAAMAPSVEAAPAAPTAPALPASVLREFPAGAGRTLRAAIAACDRGACPIELTLLEAGRPVTVVRAPLSHAEPQLSRQHVSRGQGVGDPLEAPDLDAWTSGSGDRAVTTTLRPVELKGGTTALLVTQFGGRESARPVHALFAVRGQELVRVWEAPAANPEIGRGYSTTVVPPERPSEELYLFQGFASRDDGKPDALEASAFRWDAARGRLVPGPARGKIHVLALGDFPTARGARAVREAATDCLQDYWVLPAKTAAGKPAFALTVMTTRKDLVAALAKNVRECAPQLRQRITRLP